MADNFVDTPAVFLDKPAANFKGSPGKYDGLPGWPGRTGSPNGAPEKFLEDAMPGVQASPTGTDYGDWKGASDSKTEPTKG